MWGLLRLAPIIKFSIFGIPFSNGRISINVCFFRFASGGWAILTQGGGNWEVRVKGDLSIRPDTNSINSSPVTGMLPTVRVQHGCPSTVRIPGMSVIMLVKSSRLQGSSPPISSDDCMAVSALGEFILPKYMHCIISPGM